MIAQDISTAAAPTPATRPVELGARRFVRPVVLAPMSGITDLPFRRLVARFGADMVVTEMVASESLMIRNADMLRRMAGEGLSPHVVQLAGREANWMADAARAATDAGADILDINMGCPAKRVTGGWSGSALMRDLPLAKSLIAAVVGATHLPVTVKMRLGWDRSCLNAAELARIAEAEGASLVTVHGRTRDQFYDGSADWPAIAEARAAVSIPLIANGDIVDTATARAALAASGADGVMIGRGAQGRPWLPALVAAELNGRPRPAVPAGAGLAALVAEHYELLLGHYGSEVGRRAARKHLGWYLEPLEAAAGRPHPLRPALLTTAEPARVLDLIGRAFDGQRLEMVA
jgi:nifR3 family TIM-barrel protein